MLQFHHENEKDLYLYVLIQNWFLRLSKWYNLCKNKISYFISEEIYIKILKKSF